MINITEAEILELAKLLTQQHDAEADTDHDAGYAPRALVRMWIIAALNEGFWRVSGNSALLTSASLDVLLMDMGHSEKAAILARRMSAHLKGLIAQYEAEIRKIQSLRRH